MTTADEYDLVKVLNNPEDYYPGNFETAEKAAAFLMCLCQEAADKIQGMETKDKPVGWPISGETAQRIAKKQCVSYEVVQLIAREILSLHPPTKTAPKKPMTDFREYFEEMRSQLQEDYGDNVRIFEEGFKQGARWVQMDHSPFKQHHGIGGGGE